ncbi:TPA: fimbrial protein [Salmonella enterica]|nr:fimbrial protein [Salmonella enterica]HCL4786649.1 fimbrial protein [Salmonella enterica]
MFRKTALAVMTISAVVCGSSAFAADPTGSFGTGSIHFTGTVTNSPCNVAPGDDALAVSFGQVSHKTLTAVGDTSPSQPVVIHLTDCSFDPDGGTPSNPVGLMSKVNVAFTGPSTTDNKAFTNTLGSAGNVAVQLLKSDNTTVIEANSIPTQADAQQLQAGDNQLRFFARLIAVGGAASPGSVDATVTYTLTYL